MLKNFSTYWFFLIYWIVCYYSKNIVHHKFNLLKIFLTYWIFFSVCWSFADSIKLRFMTRFPSCILWQKLAQRVKRSVENIKTTAKFVTTPKFSLSQKANKQLDFFSRYWKIFLSIEISFNILKKFSIWLLSCRNELVRLKKIYCKNISVLEFFHLLNLRMKLLTLLSLSYYNSVDSHIFDGAYVHHEQKVRH